MNDKPKVTILMAIYKPNLEWLYEQLESLNDQDYKNIELLVWDDCPEDSKDYKEILDKYITNFKYTLIKGEKNLGSTGAFAELTKLANSEYVAYCDQDDIWLKEKISILFDEALKSNANLLCSDMYVIDGEGKVVSNSITKVRPHHVLDSQNNNFKYLLAKQFVTGCTTLVKTELAKKALPFPNEFVHDWWLALYAVVYGKIQIVKKPLIKYRIHTTNQTLILTGINTKTDYLKRILEFKNRMQIVSDRFQENNLQNEIDTNKKYAELREKYFKNFSVKGFIDLFRLRECNLMTTYFELALPFMPNFLFKFVINQIRKGNI